jgi:hypothetical protein
LGNSIGNFEFLDRQDFESVAKLWLQNKKYKFVNLCTAAMLWRLWKSHNELVFQGVQWTRMKKILGWCASSIRKWRLLVRGESEELERWASELERRSLSPPRITWVAQWQRRPSLGNLRPAAVEDNSRSVDGVLYDASVPCDAPHVGNFVPDLLVPGEAPAATIVNLVSK